MMGKQFSSRNVDSAKDVVAEYMVSGLLWNVAKETFHGYQSWSLRIAYVYVTAYPLSPSIPLLQCIAFWSVFSLVLSVRG